MSCDCIQAAKILYNKREECDGLYNLINKKYDELKNYECVRVITDDNYGHINYALMSYVLSLIHI